MVGDVMVQLQMVGEPMSNTKNARNKISYDADLIDHDIDMLIEDLTLNVFTIGADTINYHIVKSLPTNVEALMKETKLTKVPINNRLNELEKCGLLRREKGTGRVHPTELTTGSVPYFL
jgi:hypothetical protein